MRTPTLMLRAFKPEIRAEDLAPGTCGRMTGIALTYDVVDAYDTIFRAGCMDRTKREKLPAGKVKLFLDHEASTRAHVGVVRKLTTLEGAEVMEADLFDTEEGRKAKEYLSACMSSGAHTGLSIGFYTREAGPVTVDGEMIYEYREIELDEVSITPRPAVPGADVLDVRGMGVHTATALMRQAIDLLGATTVRSLIDARAGDAGAETPPDSPSEERTSDDPATMDERIAALRRTY